jgi:hypothetical protein
MRSMILNYDSDTADCWSAGTPHISDILNKNLVQLSIIIIIGSYCPPVFLYPLITPTLPITVSYHWPAIMTESKFLSRTLRTKQLAKSEPPSIGNYRR